MEEAQIFRQPIKIDLMYHLLVKEKFIVSGVLHWLLVVMCCFVRVHPSLPIDKVIRPAIREWLLLPF